MLKIHHMLVSVICICLALGSCSEKRTTRTNGNQEPVQTLADTTIKRNSTIVRRTNSNEKRVLIRLVRNLEELNALIDEAEFRAQADSRIRFDYPQLRLDLSAISHGIRTHIHLPDQSPRSIEPIPGEYGR